MADNNDKQKLPPCPSCEGNDVDLSSGHYTGDSSGLFYAAVSCHTQECKADASVLGDTEAEAIEKALKVWRGEAESKPEPSTEAGDTERLARIIEANPGAELRVDNDNWHLVKPKPVGFDDWNEARQEAWWENDSELCASRDFPSLEISHGYGILGVMAGMLGLEMGEV